MLVVLDNARDADQVRPLLPGGSAGTVMVTSRNQLTCHIATDDAHSLTLGLLSEAEAIELLAGRLGHASLLAEPEAAQELTRLCARLPLALAIAAARAANRRSKPLAGLVAELRTAGLDVLTTGEPATDLRAVFSSSYRCLTRPAASMFQLLGAHPGPYVTTAAAAWLAGLGICQTRGILGELARNHLIEEQAPGKFTVHDLLRAYAIERAGAGSGDGQRSSIRNAPIKHLSAFAYLKCLTYEAPGGR